MIENREQQIKSASEIIAYGCSDELKAALIQDFPELAESEDERIRKFLVELVSNDKANNYKPLYAARGVRFDDVLAYLEKQKEQKPAEWSEDFEDNIRTLLHDKLTWHSEDGSTSSTIFIDDKTLKDIISGILFYVGKEALKYPNKELNVTKWSEEDKRAINDAIVALSMYANGNIPNILPSILLEDVDRLKSLRPSWKPSEEQMFALDSAILMFHNLKRGGDKYGLESLYADLKKLM